MHACLNLAAEAATGTEGAVARVTAGSRAIDGSGKRIAGVGSVPDVLVTTASIIVVMLSGTGVDMV